MTAVPGLRDQLAEALRVHRWEPVIGADSHVLYRCRCGFVPESSLAMDDHRADALLPVVEAAIRQHAARALRDAADDLYGPPGSVAEYPERPAWLAARLRARADAEETDR